jgi:hypothetical protein
MEIWKDVVGYEGIYKVSNYGLVKRVSKIRGVNLKYREEYYLVPTDNGKGYFRIKLSNNGKSKRVMLHRIIAEAFINNPENKKCVNHINHNRKDNRIENLEWCTHSENTLHAVKHGRWNQVKSKRNKTI